MPKQKTKPAPSVLGHLPQFPSAEFRGEQAQHQSFALFADQIVPGHYAEGCGVEWGFGSVAAVVVDFVFEVL